MSQPTSDVPSSIHVSSPSVTTIDEPDALNWEDESMHGPFIKLSKEAKELYLDSEIPHILSPSPLEFYRDFVSRNRPCIIEDTLGEWAALSRWIEPNYLRDKLKDNIVSVSRTPNGWGDAVTNGYFILPSEEKMKFSEFTQKLNARKPEDGILYCSHQNGSLNTEFSVLSEDISELSFASQAFNSPPDAVNFWMGDERAVSSLHQDPYENIYAVISGEKHFLLYPPCDHYWLDQGIYPRAEYIYQPPATPGQKASFIVKPDLDGETVPWFDLEPMGFEGPIKDGEEENKQQTTSSSSSSSSSSSDSAFTVIYEPPSGPKQLGPGRIKISDQPPIPGALRKKYTSPMWVRVQAGQVLYLPSMWYHRVAQGDGIYHGLPSSSSSSSSLHTPTIAVNFWYDMIYGTNYGTCRFIESLTYARRAISLHFLKQITKQENISQAFKPHHTSQSMLEEEEEKEKEEEEEEDESSNELSLTVIRLLRSSDYIDLSRYYPYIQIDLKYATNDNFMGQDVYGKYFRKAFLHREAAEKLEEALSALSEYAPPGSYLLVFDALRPRCVQRKLWKVVEGTTNQMYVANPEKGSLHNYGCAIDLTLATQKDGELDMGTPFDSFDPLSQPKLESQYLDNGRLTIAQHKNRLLLRKIMVDGGGFEQLPHEWWHYNAFVREEVEERFKIVE